MHRLHFMTLIMLVLSASNLQADEFRFGFAKVDVTPNTPIRLSGFASRKTVMEGVDEKIYVRAMVIETEAKEKSVLIALENTTVPLPMTQAVARQAEKAHAIPRSRVILACTHSHSAPHLTGRLKNIFMPPMTKEQNEATAKYTDQLTQKIILCVKRAVEDLQPGKLVFAKGEAFFSRSRRRVMNGQVERLEHNGGPVDRELPMLKIVDSNGKTRGIVFNFACHCTSLGGGGYNRVNGDWAGYACKFLEEENPNTIAMGIIGCGGDINPQRERYSPKRAIVLAKAAGQEIADEFKNIAASKWKPITQPFQSSFGHAVLKHEPRDARFFKEQLKSKNGHIRRRADHFLRELEKGNPIPTTYKDPIHVWKFGNQLTMVFMGGETVIDYTLRLKKELPKANLWVSAYSDDVFAYVASERIRQEGSYEADRSMVYYMRPSPWIKGTEETVIKKIHQLIKATEDCNSTK